MPSNTKIDENHMLHSFSTRRRKQIASVTDVSYDPKTTKRWMVAVKGAHCGDGFYIPRVYNVFGETSENAKNFVMSRSCIKRSSENPFLCVMEVSPVEFDTIAVYNDLDPYHKLVKVSSEELEERRIVSQSSINKLKGYIRTAEDYPEKYVYSRAFAPVMENPYETDKTRAWYVYPNKIDREQFFKDLAKQTLLMHMENGNPRENRGVIFANYYQTHGPENELGIKYDELVKGLVYRDSTGKYHTVTLYDRLSERIETCGEYIYKKEKKSVKTPEELALDGSLDGEKPKVSALDKFNARLNKTNSSKKEKTVVNDNVRNFD